MNEAVIHTSEQSGTHRAHEAAVTLLMTPPPPHQVAGSSSLQAQSRSPQILDRHQEVVSSGEGLAQTPAETTTIDPLQKQKFITLFSEAINNPRFWANLHRLERLEIALKLPVFEDRSLQQFYISARDELKAKALDDAIATATVPVLPTEDQIQALAKEKYDKKMAKEEKKKKLQ